MKKILVLAGSPRKNGNSAMLCEEFTKGAQEAGNDVEMIFLRDKNKAIVPPAITARLTTASASSRTTWRTSWKK